MRLVTDFTRRVAPFGEISGGLDLSELAMVYPLVAIPRWVASRYFYDFIGKALAYLLVPLPGVNAVYRVIAHLRARSRGEPSRGVVGDLQGLPGGVRLLSPSPSSALRILPCSRFSSSWYGARSARR
jgi:hypothetical protein